MAMTESVKSSGQVAVTAATVVSSIPARAHYLSLTPAAAASSVIVYDNASAASGTILLELKAPAAGASIIVPLDSPVMALLGITIAVTGTGATAVVHYSLY